MSIFDIICFITKSCGKGVCVHMDPCPNVGWPLYFIMGTSASTVYKTILMAAIANTRLKNILKIFFKYLKIF